jgi:hypothetical protein
MEVQQLSGNVKMVELELKNENRKYNKWDARERKRRKLIVETRVLTSAEGMRDAEGIEKAQKKQ